MENEDQLLGIRVLMDGEGKIQEDKGDINLNLILLTCVISRL